MTHIESPGEVIGLAGAFCWRAHSRFATAPIQWQEVSNWRREPRASAGSAGGGAQRKVKEMTKELNTPIPLILAILACVPIILFAQNAPIQSGMGNDESGAPKLSLSEPLPGEKMIDRLKLDDKTQAPEVRLLLMDASRDAAASGQKMLELRQTLVNLALQDKADELKAATEAYAAAAAEMAGIEARAFAKIYALLKPNQQPNAAQAFAIMAGIFQPSPSRGGGRGGQRGGGQ